MPIVVRVHDISRDGGDDDDDDDDDGDDGDDDDDDDDGDDGGDGGDGPGPLLRSYTYSGVYVSGDMHA
jgi:hypothetical protein